MPIKAKELVFRRHSKPTKQCILMARQECQVVVIAENSLYI